MSFLDSLQLKEKQTDVGRKGEARISRAYIMPWQADKPLPDTQGDKSLMIEAFNSWVYVCASKNATSVAKVPIRMYVSKKSKDKKFIVQTKAISREEDDRLRSIAGLHQYTRKAVQIEEVLDHPFFDLTKAVNPLINRFDLWETTELFLEMTGNAYWYVVRNKLGVPDSIWLIPSQGVKIVVGKENLIKGYVYRAGYIDVPFTYEEVVHFKFPSLKSQIYGYGPMQAAMDAYLFERRLKKFENTMLTNMGRPEGVLQTDLPITDADFERIKTRWRQNYQGETHAGKTLILESGLKYQQISMSPKDMQYINGRKWSREEIAAIFGVPMGKLTSDNVNKANAEAGDHQHASDTIEPRLRRLEEKINERLIPMYDDSGDVFIAYDSSVPRDNEYRLRQTQAHLSTGYSNINEERQKDGLAPVEWGDIPIMPAGMAPLGSTPAAGMSPEGDNPFPQPEGGKPGEPKPAGKPNEPKPQQQPKPAAPAAKPAEKDVDEFVDRVLKHLRAKLRRERNARAKGVRH